MQARPNTLNNSNTTMNEKREYEPPCLTAVTVRSERGYAGSIVGSVNFILFLTDENKTIESQRTDGGYWGNGDSETWY